MPNIFSSREQLTAELPEDGDGHGKNRPIGIVACISRFWCYELRKLEETITNNPFSRLNMKKLYILGVLAGMSWQNPRCTLDFIL